VSFKNVISRFYFLQNFTQSTTKFYSSSIAAPRKKLDEDKLIHEENRQVTKVSVQKIEPDLVAAAAIERNVQQSNEKTTAVSAVARKPPELPWRVTPSTEQNKLVKHYLMLSKIRLTCE
jgi:hypothetical protein